MQMIQCPNCVKLTGFKRNLGFGTFFMVVITGGLWLLAIPFYPSRCMTCGWTRTATRGAIIVLPMLLLAVLFGIFLSNIGTRRGSTATYIDNSHSVSNAENDKAAAAPVAPQTYSVAQINKSRNNVPTGTELFVQGTYYWQRWWPSAALGGDPCSNLLFYGRVRIEHGEADPRTYCRFSVVLQDEDTRQANWLECDMSPEEFRTAQHKYRYGDRMQAHGTYASSLDFQVSGGLGGVPVLDDCTLQSVPPLPATQPSPPSPTPENIIGAINAEDANPQNHSKPYPVDGDLEGDVRRALSVSNALKIAVINPVSLHREITLSGTVADESSRELAEEITSQVPGVVAVHNNLIIGGGANPQ